MLIMRGARINVMNRGDDTPLHLAASHGHRDIVQKVCMNPFVTHITYMPRGQS
jgi:ankyrin repeat protein